MTQPEYRTDVPPANQVGSLLIFGLGYTGTAIATAAAARGWRVVATSRTPERRHAPPGVELVPFDAADTVIAASTHVLETAAPDEHGDPALARYGSALTAAPALRWAGMLSTTGVYGDRAGDWVDETTPPAPTGPRGAKRLEAETQWRAAFAHCAVDLFRVAGNFGPFRSPFAEIRAGTSRRVDKPGHRFGRIHRDDITQAVLAAMGQQRAPGTRVLNTSTTTCPWKARKPRPRPPGCSDCRPATGAVRGGGAGHVPDGPQLLGREPPCGEPDHSAGTRHHLALPDLPRGAKRHPRAGASRAPAAIARGPSGATAGGHRP